MTSNHLNAHQGYLERIEAMKLRCGGRLKAILDSKEEVDALAYFQDVAELLDYIDDLESAGG